MYKGWDNLMLDTDGYKGSHSYQLPPNSTMSSHYGESRGGMYDELMFMGMQAYIKTKLINRPVTREKVAVAKQYKAESGSPFDDEMWNYIADTYNGGLPVRIQGLPEGMTVPSGNVMYQIRNTDPRATSIGSFLETSLQRAIWSATTAATRSRVVVDIYLKYLQETCDNITPEMVNFALNDFGARGAKSQESSAIVGMAVLLNTLGSDTEQANLLIRDVYGDVGFNASYTIPAMEHFTVTSWGRDGEFDAYQNMLNKFLKKDSIVAMVMDSYNIFEAVDGFLGNEEVKRQIIDSGGKVVVRPDSGDPKTIVVDILGRLRKIFGGHRNDKGYWVLPPYIGLIYGDGLTEFSVEDVLRSVKDAGFSAENVCFGMGGYLQDGFGRDTTKFAQKASAIEVDGEMRAIYKDPITDSGKRSKSGILALIRNDDGSIETILEKDLNGRENLLIDYYIDGQLLVDKLFSDVRRLYTG